jgi:PAS domain S-box-containing protein
VTPASTAPTTAANAPPDLATSEPLLELAPFGTCCFDAQLRLTAANRAAREMLHDVLRAGMPLGELVAALWAADVQAEVLREFRHVLDSGEGGCTATLARDGLRHVEWELRRLPQEAGSGVVAYIHVARSPESSDAARHSTERQLRDTEERLRLAIEHVGVCIWDLDVLTGEAYWSRTHFEVFGLAPPDDCRSSYAMWIAGVHPEDRQQVDAHWDRALRDPHGRYRDDYRIVRADTGETRWVSVNGRLLLGPDGRPVRCVGVLVDITDRKSAEMEITASRALLQDQLQQLDFIYATAPVGLCVVDRELRFVRINERLAEINGLPPEAHIGRSIRDLLPAIAAQVEPHLLEVLRTGEPRREIELRGETPAQPGVERCWVESWYPVKDAGGSVVAINVVTREVTEQRRAELELRRQREDLQTMLDVLPVGVAIAQDADAHRVYLSPAFTQMLGVAPAADGARTQQAGEARYGYRFLRDGVPVPLAELPLAVALRAGAGVRDVELDVLREDGKALNLLCSAAPLFDAAGKVRGAVSVNMDVTMLKRAQRELEAADRQKDEFLAMLAHELRNPLAPIRTAGEVLALTVAEPRAHAAIGVIRRQSAHLARLVDDLLDVSRITRGRVELRREALDVAAVVAQAVETVEPQRQEKRHELRIVADARDVRVDGDFLRLLQTFVNLLSNAIKFTPAGGHIEVRIGRDGAQATVEVRDDGTGIAPDLLPRLFDLFVQSDQALDRAQGGLGIGLSVVQRLVRMHGGDVQAFSDGAGRGARFVVRLPLASAAPAAAVAPAPRPGVARRVLVVDDNVDAADSLVLRLQVDGHDARAAYGGAEALRCVGEFRPEVVVLDIGLPEMDGYEVARRLRASEGGTALRLIALTGYGQPEDRARALAAGFDSHLVKPAGFDILKGLLGGDLPVPAPST